MEEDVTVDESNCDAILAAAPDILDLFGVRVERLDAVEDGVFMFNNNSPSPASERASQTSSPTPDDVSLSDRLQRYNGGSCIRFRLAASDGEGATDSVNKAKVGMNNYKDCFRR